MGKEFFDITINFHDIGEVTINGVNQEQGWAIHNALRLIERSKPNYSENGCLLYHVTVVTASADDEGRPVSAVSGGFLARLWRRASAWAMPLLLVGFLAGAHSAFAQDRKTRVSVVAQDGELARLLRDELSNSNVAVTTARRGDYEVTAAISPLSEDTGCRGVIGVLLIEGRDGRQLSAFIASDIAALARQMAGRFADLKKEK